jgi:adenosylmethionine-8-amino-7-oxononanoate aminotransferase
VATSHSVFGRAPRITLPTAVAGDGIYLIDSEGKRYLDACGGAAVSCLGHTPKRVIERTCQQLQQLAFAHTGFFTSEPAEQLADVLVDQAPHGIEHVYFVSGGSEAVEAALKLTRQYFLEIGQPDRTHVVGRRQSYHGNTLGALGSGGNQWRRRQFEPLLPTHMSHISPCHYYRWAGAGETPFDYGQRVANELEQEILLIGEGKVAAFVAEPVVGATMGAVPAVEGYYKRIREICDQYGVLLILDEVMCGMGRTGHLYACDDDQVKPDILCIAKSLGAGIQPIGAMLCQDFIFQAIVDGSGFFQHGHTYMGHPAACAAGLAVMEELTKPGMMPHVRTMGTLLQTSLNDALGAHPWVGNIRGRGLFVGIELVSDKETKVALDPNLKTAAHIKKVAMDHGLMCYPMSGTIDGQSGDHVLLAPPFIIEASDIQVIAEKISFTIGEVSGHSERAA